MSTVASLFDSAAPYPGKSDPGDKQRHQYCRKKGVGMAAMSASTSSTRAQSPSHCDVALHSEREM